MPDLRDPNGPDPVSDNAQDPASLDPEPQIPPRPQEGPQAKDPQATLEAIIARAIQQGLAQGLQQGFLQPIPQVAHPQHYQAQEELSEEQHYSPEHSEQGSMSEEEESRELTLSDDEGLAPDQPTFIGLFRPQRFRSLLYKALAVTRMGSPSPPGMGWVHLGVQIRLHPYLLSRQLSLILSRLQNFSPMSFNDNGLCLDLARRPMAWTSSFTKRFRLFPTYCRCHQWTALLQL